MTHNENVSWVYSTVVLAQRIFLLDLLLGNDPALLHACCVPGGEISKVRWWLATVRNLSNQRRLCNSCSTCQQRAISSRWSWLPGMSVLCQQLDIDCAAVRFSCHECISVHRASLVMIFPRAQRTYYSRASLSFLARCWPLAPSLHSPLNHALHDTL